jgi:hypothetical protein
MRRALGALVLFFVASGGDMWGQPSVRVDAPDAGGTSSLQKQTAAAAIQNYLHSWESLREAFEKNQVAALDQDFVGAAKDKLTSTIRQQSALGFGTTYLDRAHEIKIVFYSPEGLSLELEDTVDYDVQLIGHGAPTEKLNRRARYFVVLTPAETRWRVRVFQAEHD